MSGDSGAVERINFAPSHVTHSPGLNPSAGSMVTRTPSLSLLARVTRYFRGMVVKPQSLDYNKLAIPMESGSVSVLVPSEVPLTAG